ncbi:toll/interleukin-1 receptor domain-containing protein, partial [Erysipelothrix aquatica]
MWDVFISHASEDKDKIVKPLANTLRNFGVSVWYDEFELKLGDSLSKSIDKGLINSKFGVIVLSPSFFEKGWTDYELRSLTNKEIGNKKVILPVWHDITREEISAHSLFLADKFAIPTNLGLNELSQKIIEIVRPDIINTFALKAFARTGNFTKEKISLNNILQSEVERHKTLPSYVSISVKLMCDVMADIGLSDYNFFLSNLKKDADYDSEYIIWNAITCSYI